LSVYNQDDETIPIFGDYILLFQFIRHKQKNRNFIEYINRLCTGGLTARFDRRFGRRSERRGGLVEGREGREGGGAGQAGRLDRAANRAKIPLEPGLIRARAGKTNISFNKSFYISGNGIKKYLN
jgi:hypothetical protein